MQHLLLLNLFILSSMNLFDSRIYDSMVLLLKQIYSLAIKNHRRWFFIFCSYGLSETTTSRRQDYSKPIFVTVPSIIFLYTCFIRINFGRSFFPYIMDPDESIDINNLSDLRFAEFILSSRFDSPNSRICLFNLSSLIFFFVLVSLLSF